MITRVIFRRKFVYSVFVSVTVFVLYFLFILSSQDPRIMDNSLGWNEAYWWEIFLILQCLIMIFGLFFFAIYHAYFILGQKKWIIFIFLFWPMAFVYAWKFFPNLE